MNTPPKIPAGDLMRQGVYTAVGAGAVTVTALLILNFLTRRQNKAGAANTAPGGCGCGCGGGK